MSAYFSFYSFKMTLFNQAVTVVTRSIWLGVIHFYSLKCPCIVLLSIVTSQVMCFLLLKLIGKNRGQKTKLFRSFKCESTFSNSSLVKGKKCISKLIIVCLLIKEGLCHSIKLLLNKNLRNILILPIKVESVLHIRIVHLTNSCPANMSRNK